MLTAIDVANYFLNKDKGKTLFNRKRVRRNGQEFCEGNARLNKYLHIAQNLFIAKEGAPLYPEPLYAYDDGAVVIDVQENYIALLKHQTIPSVPADLADFLDRLYRVLENATLDELIAISREDPEWKSKQSFYAKQDRRMNPLAHIAEYQKQYRDMLHVMDPTCDTG